MKCITILGYMCVGKTTVGRELAKRLGCTFYDLDWYIEERFRKKIPQIFAEEGEAYFRDLERRMLREVAEFENIVLSVGGGTPCFHENMEYLNQTTDTFYLRATPDTILRHLAMSKGRRPLLEGKSPEELTDFVTTQLTARTPFYEQAQYVVDIDVLTDQEKVSRIVDHIAQTEGLS